MTSNSHYYPCWRSFPLEIWDISLLFTHFSFNFSEFLLFRISYFLPFGGLASLKSAPLKVQALKITYNIQCIVYRMWFYFKPIISKDLKHHLSVNCSAIISPTMSNGYSAYSGTYLFQNSLYKTHCCEYLWYFWLPVAEQKSSS